METKTVTFGALAIGENFFHKGETYQKTKTLVAHKVKDNEFVQKHVFYPPERVEIISYSE